MYIHQSYTRLYTTILFVFVKTTERYEMEKEKHKWIVKVEGNKVQMPQEIQDHLGVKPGDTIEFNLEGLNDDIVITKKHRC